MRKILIVALLLWNMAAAAQNMDELWRKAPDSVVPVLTPTNRLDMADFIASNMQARVTNRFGGQSVMDTLTQDYLHITLTSQTVMEMKHIPRLHTILVAHTAMGRSTHIAAYDEQWNVVELPVAYPKAEDFVPEDTDAYLLGLAKSTGTVTARFQPGNDAVVFTLHIEDMPREERKRLQPLLRECSVEAQLVP